MNNCILITALGSFIVGGLGGYLVVTTNHMSMRTYDSENKKTSNKMHLMHRDEPNMGGGMDHGMTMVSSEKEFITEMIPHHQEAVDTARQVLERGATTPEIKSLMENIILNQEKEIADMKSWYESWYGSAYQPSGNYKSMMRDLSELRGVEIDKVFLEDMVMHHMGAIMMAHSVQRYIEHDEIKNLTNTIIESQSDEINLMRRLSEGL